MTQEALNSVSGLFAISMLCTVTVLFFAKGAFAVSVKSVCSIALLMAVFSVFNPLFNAIADISVKDDDTTMPPPDIDFEDTVTEETERILCDYIKDMLCKRFTIDKSTISVSVTLEEDKENQIHLDSVTLLFSASPPVSEQIVSDTVSQIFMCKCIVLLPQ